MYSKSYVTEDLYWREDGQSVRCLRNVQSATTPTVTTSGITDITQITATGGGEVTSDGGAEVTARGVCWSTSQNPTITDSHTGDGTGTGVFVSNLTELTPNTLYYVRAYATNSLGTAYGNEVNFTTLEQTSFTCGTSTVTDIDGNVYNTVQISEQCWMKENLKTTKYSNGTDIPNVTNNSQWSNLTTGAYAWYNHNISWKDKYGALYNWFAAIDTSDICPAGWHVPTIDEWTVLTDYIGGIGVPHGNELKSCRQIDSPLGGDCNTSEHPRWQDDLNTGYYGTDDYEFSGLPGGERSSPGSFNSIGMVNALWTSSGNTLATSIFLGSYLEDIIILSQDKQVGNSIRCLKD